MSLFLIPYKKKIQFLSLRSESCQRANWVGIELLHGGCSKASELSNIQNSAGPTPLCLKSGGVEMEISECDG